MKTSTAYIAVAFLLLIAGGYAVELIASPAFDNAPNAVRIAELPNDQAKLRPEKWERLDRLFQETSRYARSMRNLTPPVRQGAPLLP